MELAIARSIKDWDRGAQRAAFLLTPLPGSPVTAGLLATLSPKELGVSHIFCWTLRPAGAADIKLSPEGANYLSPGPTKVWKN